MLDKRAWREQWAAMEQAEMRSLRAMTVEESMKIYLSLCQAMAPFIEETKDVFLADRRAYLLELQERLRKFGEWKRGAHGSSAEPA